MPSSLIDSLIEYGMAGLFLAFMVWQHVANQKRADSQLDKFEQNLNRLRRENQEEVNELRERYEVVINKYQNERELQLQERQELRNAITNIIEKNSSVLEQTTGSIDSLKNNFKDLITSIQCLVKANEETRNVMSDMKTNIRDLISERRVIEAAKAAAQSAVKK